MAVFSSVAVAHTASKSQLTLQIDGTEVHGQLVASLIDVALALRVPIDQPATQMQEQVEARPAEWQAYLSQGFVLFLDGQPVNLDREPPRHSGRDGEAVLIFPFHVSATAPVHSLDVLYTLFFEDDGLHECLTRVEWRGGAATNGVIRLSEPLLHVDRGGARGSEFRQFLKTGALHVWTGYDHLLFLIALLLPSVLVGRPGAWKPSPHLHSALWRVAAIVSAFTLAHTATLALAAIWRIELAPGFVEPAIAASVLIAAGCNLVPRATALRGAWMALAFGLVHGTAFGQTLRELISDQNDVLAPLLAFNLGVEVGQLAVVAAFFPLAWTLRSTQLYRRGIVGGGSAVLCVIAAVWLVLRLR